MIYVGIDVAKDKHDCCILNQEAEPLFPVFTIENNYTGYELLHERIRSASRNPDEIKVGLEATGHYSYNVLGSLLDHGYNTCVINPLHTNLYRKGHSLRKTKTDKVDARSIAEMLVTDKTLKPYTDTSYHSEDLKSLTRYRFDKVQERAKLKTSVARLVNILFPELEHLVPTLHMNSVYELLEEMPGASFIAKANLTHLKSLLSKNSKGHYQRDKALEIREAAIHSVGSVMAAKSMELKHTIKLIRVMTEEIDEVEASIKEIMDDCASPIMTIPGISYRMGAMILAEIGDFQRFDNADKLLAFAGISPSRNDSGQFESSNNHMEKRGSKYLRYALFNAAIYVCMWDERFGTYLAKKRAEGKHYYVALSHVIRKLLRTIYRMELTQTAYKPL